MDNITQSPEEFCQLDFDIIVIGGGTAGLAVASRLAQGDTTLVIGVIEAGGKAHPGEEDIKIPAYYGRSLGGKHDWKFETVPQPGLRERSLPWPRGKVLGGTSALNFMTWNRASREDYGAWEALGNAGWGWDDLLPFFKKSETFHPPSEDLCKEYDISHDPGYFGKSGPIDVCYSTEYSPSHRLWHKTLNEVGVETNQAHVAGSNVGVWTNVNAVDPTQVTRSYATSYCSDQLSNLHLLLDAVVLNVELKDVDGEMIATGVCLESQGQAYTVAVKKEVIISAGTVKSPLILEQSGIGNTDVLQAARIAVKVVSPMVGENLQDHMMLAHIFEVDDTLANPDDLKHDKTMSAAALESYTKSKAGPLAVLPCSICYVPFSHFMDGNVLSALHTKAEHDAVFSKEKNAIAARRLDGHAHLGQIEYIFDLGNWNPYFEGESGKKYGTMLQILQYPFSVGSIHTPPSQSRDDTAISKIDTQPVINPKYYGGSNGNLDLEAMKACARFAQKVVQTKPLSTIIGKQASPTLKMVDDEQLLHDWILDNTITDWHPVGTCGMGGRSGIKGGVVDERLRVYGVHSLRVIDASIMPLQISAHLQATVYAIAERGAHMILEDLATAKR